MWYRLGASALVLVAVLLAVALFGGKNAEPGSSTEQVQQQQPAGTPPAGNKTFQLN